MSNEKFSETGIMKMLEFLIDRFFNRQLAFLITILLTDLFLYLHKADLN